MTKVFVSFAVIIIVSAFSSPCSAIEINKDGFEIEIYYKEKGDGMHVWGNVEKGRSCKQLTLEIFLENTDSKELSRVIAGIKNYSGGRSPYKGKDELYRGGKKKKWFIDDVYLKCLN